MEQITIGKKGKSEYGIQPSLINRHGLIAGATGTGKTVTLQRMAEQFAEQGIPVFMADIKGDLSGICKKPEILNTKVLKRFKELKIKPEPKGYSTRFWDIAGEQGIPCKATVKEMGPVLLSRILFLNQTQSSTLSIVFSIISDEGWVLNTLEDLRRYVGWVTDEASSYAVKYGKLSTSTLGVIQRGVLDLISQGGDDLFGPIPFDIEDLIDLDTRGQGVVNILVADSLINNPRVYSTYLLHLLSQLFEKLPEVGDLEKPRLVFFFDEAHLLFTDTPRILLEKIAQVVRLIRSKGVGVYFISQSPADIPDKVLSQLGNRVQHALRAFTPREQKSIRTTVQTFRQRAEQELEPILMQLGIGEALVSFLDVEGIPNFVEKVKIIPPNAQIGPITDEERALVIENSGMNEKYAEKEMTEIEIAAVLRDLKNKVNKQAIDAEMEEWLLKNGYSVGSKKEGKIFGSHISKKMQNLTERYIGYRLLSKIFG